MKYQDIKIGDIFNDLKVISKPYRPTNQKTRNRKVKCLCLRCKQETEIYLTNLNRTKCCKACSIKERKGKSINIANKPKKEYGKKSIQQELRKFCKRHDIPLEIKGDKMYVNHVEIIYKDETFIIKESGKKFFKAFYEWRRKILKKLK